MVILQVVGRVPRSLCNTFGGCGGKRSLQRRQINSQSQQVPDFVRSIQVGPTDTPVSIAELLAHDASGDVQQQAADTAQNNNRGRRNPTVGAMAEVIRDLVEYMQNSERYKQGKYVLLLTRQIPVDGQPIS